MTDDATSKSRTFHEENLIMFVGIGAGLGIGGILSDQIPTAIVVVAGFATMIGAHYAQ